jgi:hypothetical protein
LKRISVAAKRLKNLESDVARANSDVFGFADAEIDVANVASL